MCCRFDTMNSKIVKVNKSDILEGQGSATRSPVMKKFNPALQKFLNSNGAASGYVNLPDVTIKEFSDVSPLPPEEQSAKEPPVKEPPADKELSANKSGTKKGDNKSAKEEKKNTNSMIYYIFLYIYTLN